MTAGIEPALSASEWLSGINRGKYWSAAWLWNILTHFNTFPDKCKMILVAEHAAFGKVRLTERSCSVTW